MRVVQFPSREYYLQKSRGHRGSPFIFFTRATKDKSQYVSMGNNNVPIPKELLGKKLLFKVEVYIPKK